MIEKIDVPVTVYLLFDSQKRSVSPKLLEWNGRRYKVNKVGLHHRYKKGNVLYHVFSVSTKTMFFRLTLNTENLHWRLEEISDGRAG